MLTNLLTAIGFICSKATTTFSIVWCNNEPSCPKSLIK